jgi:branched-chain amino acid transport system permease protein
MSVLENVAIGTHLRGSAACFPRPGAWSARKRNACSPKPPGRSAGRAEAHMHDEASALGQQRIIEIARALAADPACCSSTSRPPACASRRRKPWPSC